MIVKVLDLVFLFIICIRFPKQTLSEVGVEDHLDLNFSVKSNSIDY